ncbi:Hypothetical predicted protein [Mytilus galloprovincialis]|uniref:DNA-directed DNA polymerase n=1 Tax=Mytilus galloprovincialis TaxID=29158 RepID=A0A8B6BLU8_MYTGA|nr:Hypothetical predicted protein [Mytilus galloprovincialis]
MLLMFEKGIHGGITVATQRYAKANNPYIEGYDASKPTNYLMYADANNLYGWAMSKHLPTGGFQWINPDDIPALDTLTAEDDQDYVLEVDLEYPKDLQDYHNDYPLAPEAIQLKKVRKLVPNFGDKIKYVVHYVNLKQYLALGVKLRKKYYIDLNTALRAAATTDFQKDFFKLMNNAMFGKPWKISARG